MCNVMKTWNAFFCHSISHPRPQSTFVNQTQQQFCKANGLGSKELEMAVLQLLAVMKEPVTELKQCIGTWPSYSLLRHTSAQSPPGLHLGL